MNPLEWGARRRQHDLERRAQDAFLAEIAVHWQPVTPRQRRLMWRSSLTHLRERVLGGGPTMAGVAVASVPTAIGTALLTMSPVAHRLAFRAGPPPWASALLTLGLFGLIVELVRSPRRIRVRRFTVLAALPLAAGSLVSAVSLHWHFGADRALALGLYPVGLGMALICAVCVRGESRIAERAVRWGLLLTAIGCLLVVSGDYPWAWMYLRDHDREAASGCFFSSAGILLIALSLLRSNPEVSR